MVRMEDVRLPAIRGGGNLERYEISQAQRWYAAAILTPTSLNHRGCIHPADGYRLPESASSLRPPRSLDNQLFRREKFQADLLFPTIFR